MTISDRLKRIAAYYGLTVRDFERKAGLANGYVRTIGNSMGSNKVESILTAFPEVSRVWLLTGEGEMLKNSIEVEKKSPAPDLVQVPEDPDIDSLAMRLLALVESQQRTLADNAATIKRQTEELSALRLKIEALTEGGIREIAEDSPVVPAPSPAGSVV